MAAETYGQIAAELAAAAAEVTITADVLSGYVRRMHRAVYPNGCPLGCETCRPACSDCGTRVAIADMQDNGIGGHWCAACASLDPRDRSARDTEPVGEL